MSKRFYQNLGIALIALPALVALAIQLWTGDVVSVSTQSPEIIGHGGFGGVTKAYVIHLSLHWAVLLPLLTCCIAGLSCIVISSRR